MQPTRTYHDAGRNFEKAYRTAAIAFGIILGLNTLVLIGIGIMQTTTVNPEFGPPGVVLGLGAIFAGITIGLTGAIARRQRWAAITGLIVLVLTMLAAFANWAVELGDAGQSGARPTSPVCGVVIFALAIIALVKAIGARPPQPMPLAESTWGYQGQSEYNPYGNMPALPTQTPKVRKLGSFGMAALILGGLLVVGGGGAAVMTYVSETTVQEGDWQTVTDEKLRVSVDMPGTPTRTPSSNSGSSYEMSYVLERHQYSVSLNCTRLHPEWYFEESQLVSDLKNQIEREFVVSTSESKVTVNGIEMHRVHYRLKDNGQAYAQGYIDGVDGIIVTVIETEAINGAVADRVLNSLRRK